MSKLEHFKTLGLNKRQSFPNFNLVKWLTPVLPSKRNGSKYGVISITANQFKIIVIKKYNLKYSWTKLNNSVPDRSLFLDGLHGGDRSVVWEPQLTGESSGLSESAALLHVVLDQYPFQEGLVTSHTFMKPTFQHIHSAVFIPNLHLHAARFHSSFISTSTSKPGLFCPCGQFSDCFPSW